MKNRLYQRRYKHYEDRLSGFDIHKVIRGLAIKFWNASMGITTIYVKCTNEYNYDTNWDEIVADDGTTKGDLFANSVLNPNATIRENIYSKREIIK